MKDRASRCSKLVEVKRTRGALQLQEAHHHTHQGTRAAATFPAAAGHSSSRQPPTEAPIQADSRAAHRRHTLLASSVDPYVHQNSESLLLQFTSHSHVEVFHRPFAYSGVQWPSARRRPPPHRFRLSTGGDGIGVGGGRPWDSTRIDHSTCTSSHWHDLTSSYRM